MNDCGFLAPSGILTCCEPYEHLCVAMDICKREGLVPGSLLQAEEHLENEGYLIIRPRDIYGRIGMMHEGKIIHLTKMQRKWLEEHYEDMPECKQRDADKIMDEYDKW